MSLIKCSECGNEISDKASSCPHCGCPINVIQPETSQNTAPIENNIIPNDTTSDHNTLNEQTVNTNDNDNEKKINKRGLFIVLGIIAFIIIIMVIKKSNTVTMPQLYNVTEETATVILTNNSLIPNIIYEYDDYVEKGNVFETSPIAHDEIDKNSIVTVYVSKGPKLITSKNSVIQWYNIVYNKDDKWEFESPYITNDKLYIKCTPVFKTSFSWKDEGYGEASIVDTFAKKVPVEINYDNKNVKSGVKQNIELVIPVSDLDVQKPTTLFLHLSIIRNKVQEHISINFSITW